MIKIKTELAQKLRTSLRNRFVIENKAVKDKKTYEENGIDYK